MNKRKRVNAAMRQRAAERKRIGADSRPPMVREAAVAKSPKWLDPYSPLEFRPYGPFERYVSTR